MLWFVVLETGQRVVWTWGAREILLLRSTRIIWSPSFSRYDGPGPLRTW